jgi:hypothetical protein
MVDFIIVGGLGVLVGASEIVARYRDAPWHAIGNFAAVAYLAVNAAAAATALYMIRSFGLTFGSHTDAGTRTLQILVAGFGAIAFLRTSFFVLRVGGRDIGIGPVTLLQVLLFATDREVDRQRAVRRAKEVVGAMRGLSYRQAHQALPEYCLTLMQNVTPDEAADVRQRVKEIDEVAMEDALKANALGLALMNIVGVKVLKAAADAARSRVLERGVLGEVYPRLGEVLQSSAAHGEKTLDVLGLTLHTAWPTIRGWLMEENSRLRGWTVRLRVVDPELVPTLSWFDQRWASEAKNVLDDVLAFNQLRGDALASKGTRVEIKPYALVPAVHGFKCSDGTYFVSIARWDDTSRTLGRPYQSYECLTAEDVEPRALHQKELFDNWMQRADEAVANRVCDEGGSATVERGVVAVQQDGGDALVGQ